MARMKRRYAKARTDETEAMCGLSSKFVIPLLNGSYRYRPHRGRASSYSPEPRKTLIRLWLAMGQMFPRYLHAVTDAAIRDYSEAKAPIPGPIADELRRMSVSTITRLYDHWSLLNNPTIPCTRQIAKIRRAIDAPQTPWQRLNALLPQSPPPHLNAIAPPPTVRENPGGSL